MRKGCEAGEFLRLGQAPPGISQTGDEAVGSSPHRGVLGVGHQIPAMLKEPQGGVHRPRMPGAERLCGIAIGRELVAVEDRQRRLDPHQAEPPLGDMVVGDVTFLVGPKKRGQVRAHLGKERGIEVDPRLNAVEDGDRGIRQIVPVEHGDPAHDGGIRRRGRGRLGSWSCVEQVAGQERQRDAEDEPDEHGDERKARSRHAIRQGKQRTALEP